jgi:hypothetical protein
MRGLKNFDPGRFPEPLQERHPIKVRDREGAKTSRSGDCSPNRDLDSKRAYGLNIMAAYEL